jgi:protein gp37
MFPFITSTWNPLGGECLHNCSYCWAKELAKKYNMKKYTGKPTLSIKELSRVFQHKDFVFTCDMCDLFGEWVPTEFIQRILDRMLTSQATYLLLTKNPARYLEFDLPKNCVAGATIETDLEYS